MINLFQWLVVFYFGILGLIFLFMINLFQYLAVFYFGILGLISLSIIVLLAYETWRIDYLKEICRKGSRRLISYFGQPGAGEVPDKKGALRNV